jgi:hypothetical protein
VRCELCATPHHQDCWEYWGRCSIYACTGMRRGGPIAAAAAREVLRIVDDGDRIPVLVGDFFDPFVTKRVIYYAPAAAEPYLEPGEVAVQITPETLPASGGDPTRPLIGMAEEELELARRQFARERQGRAAWVVRRPDGEMAVQLAPSPGGWMPKGFRQLLAHTPTRLHLRRLWVDLERPDGLYSLVCRLALASGDTLEVDISPELVVPRAGEPRGPFLAQLVRLRAVGRAISDLLGLPLHERFGGADAPP